MQKLILSFTTKSYNDISLMLREIAECVDRGYIPDAVVIDKGFDEKEMRIELETESEG